MKRTFLWSLTIAMALSGEISAQVNSSVTTATRNLYNNLKTVAWNSKNILFGQEYFNSLNWNNVNLSDPTFSDFKSVTGDNPAVLGQDIEFYLSKPWEVNNDKAAAQYVYSHGGVVTFDFHMNSKYHSGPSYNASSDQYLMYNIGNNNDNYGEVTWFKSELDSAISVINGLKIPVVLRIFHEMNGNWFWWGNQAAGGATSYIKMYQFAVNYIKSRTPYALFAWSPNYPFDGTSYPGTSYYPGDQYVDVVGMDMYDENTSAGQPFSTMVTELQAVSDFAWNHQKVPIFAEVGNRVNNPNDYNYWWYNVNQNIQASNRSFKIAWMLTWVNENWSPNPPYVAYTGSNAGAQQGLKDFKNMSTILTLSDAPNLNLYGASSSSSNVSNANANNPAIAISKDASSAVSLFPNPTAVGNFNVNLGSYKGTFVNITVTDIGGNQVINKQHIPATSVINIPVFGLTNGIYIVTITGDGLNQTQNLKID